MIAYAKTVEEIISQVNRQIINPFIIFISVLAVVVFLWGIIEFLYNSDNEEKIIEGKKHIFWGLIGLAIMIGVYGIMTILNNFWYS